MSEDRLEEKHNKYDGTTPIRERLYGRVRADAKACWVWQGCTSKGYGRIRYNGKQTTTHRVSYELQYGPIPKTGTVDHLCRNRKCINPLHLQVVSIKENVLRGIGITANNSLKTHCPAGHPYSGDNLAIRGHSRQCRTCQRERWHERDYAKVRKLRRKAKRD